MLSNANHEALRQFPSASPVSNMRGTRNNYVYVKISTDEGIVGWGESTCGPLSVAQFVEEIGATLVGKDPFRIEEHWQRLYHLYHNVRGGVIQMAAISGIEIALWDIKGKAFNAPVWQLLGGQMRDRIWTYGRFDGETPELAVEHALRQVDTGLTALKGDPFGHQGTVHHSGSGAGCYRQGEGGAGGGRRRCRAIGRSAREIIAVVGNPNRQCVGGVSAIRL